MGSSAAAVAVFDDFLSAEPEDTSETTAGGQSEEYSAVDQKTDAETHDLPESLRTLGEAVRPWSVWSLSISFAKVAILFVLILLSTLAVLFVRLELNTSLFQSYYLSRLAKQLTYETGSGPSPEIRFPEPCPYDTRFGYALFSQFTANLQMHGFQIASQARISRKHAQAIDHGVFPIYHQKTQAGLALLDRDNELFFQSNYPERAYPRFELIPKLVLDTLLFIEDRNLLDPEIPRRNPAIEWDRFGKAFIDYGISRIDPSHQVTGGSTLATQIEKFRHSPEGITTSGKDKLRQMASASIRAYLEGEDNLPARRQVVLDYINSVPLAAIPGYGEVNGLGDGLWAYYGADFDEVSRLLRTEVNPTDAVTLKAQALAYREVLSLFLAHRRPTEYLGDNQRYLTEQMNRYLPLLMHEHIIPRTLYESVAKTAAPFRRSLPPPPRVSYLDRKAASMVRTHLLSMLGLERLYELDRLDLTAHSTLDDQTQKKVTKILNQLRDPEYAKSVGLEGVHLLDKKGDPGKIIYSFTLYERGEGANLLRVQTDNYDQPFNINEGVKLDLGSTAKLRTLITYLEIIEELNNKFVQASPKELAEAKKTQTDVLSQWALLYLTAAKDKSLHTMLQAAMDRQYSANPGEQFFTAGGMHTFHNFKPEDNGRVVPVREAIRNSINLPFIRLMRDIVNYFSLTINGSTARTLEKMKTMDRQEYLARFADEEGKVFMRHFYEKYRGKKPDEILQAVLEGVKHLPVRHAAVFSILYPHASFAEFSKFMRDTFPEKDFTEVQLQKLSDIYSIVAKSLGDKGYLARVHPLELWTAGYLINHPAAKLSQVLADSNAERQDVYNWLFVTRHRHAQDRRIRIMVEAEAFSEIYRHWKHLGYPLDSLVPSYATALGTSADRPDGLATLMGIIQNNGTLFPPVRVQKLDFAVGTPFETVFEHTPAKGEPVLSPEIVSVVRPSLLEITASGTAARLHGGFKNGDHVFLVGGKTGTGDHRFQVYSRGGGLKESRVVNRTATFVFFIGDRFFGTLTAFVRGPDAAKFSFTSALPVQLVKIVSPAILPLLERGEHPRPAPSAPPKGTVIEKNVSDERLR